MAEITCENCEAKIGDTDKVCPKCGADLEVLPQEVESVERALKIIERRKAKATPPTPTPEPETPKKKLTIFQALALKRKGNK